MDKRIRELERRATQGDIEAKEELKRHLARTRTPTENLKQAFIDFLLDYDNEFAEYADEFLEIKGDVLYFYTEDCTIVSYIEGIGPLQDVVDEHNFYTEPNEDIWGFTFHPKKVAQKKTYKKLPTLPTPNDFQLLSTFIDENLLEKRDIKRLKNMFGKIPMSKKLDMNQALCSYNRQHWDQGVIDVIIKVPVDQAKAELFNTWYFHEDEPRIGLMTKKDYKKVGACIDGLMLYLVELLEAATAGGRFGRLDLVFKHSANLQTVYADFSYEDDGYGSYLKYFITAEKLV